MQEITSIAKSLGVARVSNKTWDLVQQRPNIRSVVLRDADAARACVRFAEEQKMIVEPACGVSLALFYDGLLEKLIPDFGPESRVIVIVCGGSNVDVERLLGYQLEYGRAGKLGSIPGPAVIVDGTMQVQRLGSV